MGTCDVYTRTDPQQEDRQISGRQNGRQYHAKAESVFCHFVDLTRFGLAYPVELVHGQKYYVTVEAVNNVVHGGALVTTVKHSTPLIIDTTPPVIDGVRVVMFDSSTGFLSTELNAR